MAKRSARCGAGLAGLVLILGLPVPASADPTPSAGSTPGATTPQITPVVAKPGMSNKARPLQSPQVEADFAVQARLRPTAQELTRQATVAGSDIAGVRIDLAAEAVHVYRTDTAKALRLPAGIAGTAKVVTHPARFSHTAMTTAMANVIKGADALVAGGIQVEAVEPNVDGSGITVTVVGGSATASPTAATLRSRFGDVVAKVATVARTASDKDLYFDGRRFNDFAPWFGGDRLHVGCTTGFSAMLGSQPAMLTAAHCGGTGSQFYNGPNSSGGYSYMGEVVQANGDTDISVIAVSDSFPYVNVGPAQNSYQMLVLNWGAPIVGSTVCQSGSYTGEVCQLQVVTNYVRNCLKRNIFGTCKRWTGYFANAINLAGAGVPAAGHGDSGGPIYEFGAPSAGVGNAVGQVNGVLRGSAASDYPAYYPDTLLCDAPEGLAYRCSSGFAFAHMPGY